MGKGHLQGKYKVDESIGYKEGTGVITYRSSYELKAFDRMRWLYYSNKIKSWSSESSVFTYDNPIKQKESRYFMDLTIEKLNGDVIFVEIKPFHETVPPKVPRKGASAESYKRAVQTFMINSSKWNAVKEWCEEHSTENKKYSFAIWTERTLKI